MTRSEANPTPEELIDSPEAAFSVLGDETRLSILLELAEVASEQGPEAGVGYAELRDRVGVTDSGRFNYHLNQLRGGFIEKEGGEYSARYPGLQIVSTVYAGLYDDREQTTTESALDCPRCERSLQIVYEDTALLLRCTEHGPMTGYPVPPGALDDRTLEEAMTVAFRRAISEMELAMDGVCQRCWGQVEVDWPVEPADTGMAPEGWVWAAVTCERCWLRYDVPYRSLVAAHPTVRSFYVAHGHDQTDAVVGPRATGNAEVCVFSLDDDGRRGTLTVTLDGETLSLTFDGDLDLVGNERRPATDHERERERERERGTA